MEKLDVNVASFVERRVLFTAEHNLLIAIFERALLDNFKPGAGTSRKDVRSARAYFEDEHSLEYGTFGHFCAYLNLCPKRVLQVIKEGNLTILRKQNGRPSRLHRHRPRKERGNSGSIS
jgi:hypothetical protein